MQDPSIEWLNQKYSGKLHSLLKSDSTASFTSSYEEFKREYQRAFKLNTFYEKFCSVANDLLSFIDFGKNSQARLAENLEISGINANPKGVIRASLLSFSMFLLTAIPIYLVGATNFAFFVAAAGAFMSYVIYSYPSFTAQVTKMIAQQESLLAILYMSIYMKVSPVLENAVFFATQHLEGPLGRDLKQILWLVDSERVGSIEEAVNQFTELWLKRNPEFVKAMMTLHSVLTQPDEENQSRILNKALDTVLNETYEKMKQFSHELQGPVMILQTFGMMLPLIGLIAFPMMSVFMSDSIRMSHLFFGYVLVLPALLWFFINRVLSKRPGAFSYPDVSKNQFLPPDGKYALKFNNKVYNIPLAQIAFAVAVLIMIPGIWHLITATIPAFMESRSLPKGATLPLSVGNEYEPIPMFITLTIPAGIAAGFIIFFYFRSIQKLRLRNQIIEIEDDLADSLFQLGNQFTERIPIEDALGNFVDEYSRLNMKKRSVFTFFYSVLEKIQGQGLTFSEAIFNPKEGIIARYPSILLKEICWILVEGARKGSAVLYNVTLKISTYLSNVKKIRELMYDLLAETVSSIDMQAKFLAPFIAAIVGSMTLIIVKALYMMSTTLEKIMAQLEFASGSGSSSFFSDFVNFARITPPTVFQVLVGVYMVETVILLSILRNGVESGFDTVSRDIVVARNLFIAIIVYVAVTIIGVVALNSFIQQGGTIVGP